MSRIWMRRLIWVGEKEGEPGEVLGEKFGGVWPWSGWIWRRGWMVALRFWRAVVTRGLKRRASQLGAVRMVWKWWFRGLVRTVAAPERWERVLVRNSTARAERWSRVGVVAATLLLGVMLIGSCEDDEEVWSDNG